ncbi:MAG: antibiotic biosynthesis monooxygenase [Cyanobacteriota bacterium]|nr:antibiotic biosynthesis monooxygenase [Cyanobacteriota bacterium]
MSDFLDFLSHKFAYVARGEFKPGRFSEAEDLFQKAVSTYTHGFKGAYLLQEPGTDKGIAVIFWEHREDMETNHSETYEAILSQMSHLFVAPPTTAFYEVASEIHETPNSQPQEPALV